MTRITLNRLAGLTLASVFALTAAAQAPEAPKPAEAGSPPASLATQAPATPPAPTGPSRPYTGPMSPTSVHIFPLSSTTTAQMQNEILVTIRNILDPRVKVTMSPTGNTFFIAATDDQIALAQKIIDALDKPSKTYRLTYTLIDLDGTKRVGDQHYSMIVVPGQRAVLKQGNRVPVVTGAYLKEMNAPQSQITYLDVGMSFDATLDDSPNALRLKTKVEQSSVVEDRTSALSQDPVVRQSLFEGSALLSPGKPLIIGTLDITGTTRRVQIQATIEPLTP